MKGTDQHSALQMRVKTLGLRINALKQTMRKVTEAKRIEKLGELDELERRHKHLEERLHQIGREGSGMRQDADAELSLMADDLDGVLDSFMFSIEEHYVAGEHLKSHRKP